MFNFVWLIQNCLSYSGPFASSYKLENRFIKIHKITSWDFNWNSIESINNVGVRISLLPDWLDPDKTPKV